ncbi:MAG: hypothetical protein OEY19_11040 [Gammaproteobacteria bacterium]|nr:hypothetical protein [Gammaproteobacteria bacterium]
MLENIPESMKAIPRSKEISSDNITGAVVIEDIKFHRGKLNVLTYAAINSDETDTAISYNFDYIEGMLLLDEGDLITLWENGGFHTGHILYEISDGSIFEQISAISGVLSVSLPFERLDDLKEFVICSQDDCLLVLSKCEPEIMVNEYNAQ